jgi:hypothetical protein
MQGLTLADLCVSVQPATASVQPGGAATFTVTVAVEGGFTADVTAALGAGATYTSGCPDGDGSASCWIASMNLLGSASSVQMQAQMPTSAGATSVSLTATASVPTLLPWTPPSAAATVAVNAPAPTPTPSPAAAKTTHAPTATRSTPVSQRAPSSPGAPAARHSAGPVATGIATAGAIADPTLPPIPLPSLPQPSTTEVSPGSASGLFPTISATASPGPSAQAAADGVSTEAAGYQVPLAPAGLVIAILIALGGAGLGGRHLYRNRRGGKP